MQAEYLAACKILANTNLGSSESVEFNALLAQTGVDPMLSNAIEFWRIQQLWERLLGLTDQSLSSVPTDYLPHLLEHSGVNNMRDFLNKKSSMSDYVQHEMASLFGDKPMSGAEIEEWLETQVNWQ